MLFPVLIACATAPTEVPLPAPPVATEPAALPPAAAAVAVTTDSALPVELTGTTGPIKATAVYHGTALVEAMGLRIWIDPWSKANLAGATADVVLITDIHFDHFDVEALAKVLGPNTVVVAPPAVAEQYTTKKVGFILKNGEHAEVKGIGVDAVPMYNLVRGPEAGKLFHDPGRGNGYVLTIEGKRLYFAGDTECTPEMRALANIDLAFVPMNLPYTMTPEESAGCVAGFKPKQVVAYHYAGSNLSLFKAALSAETAVTVLDRNAYPGGLPW